MGEAEVFLSEHSGDRCEGSREEGRQDLFFFFLLVGG